MKYTGLDPILTDEFTIALSQDNKENIDLYNACVLIDMRYSSGKLRLKFVKVYNVGPMPNGTQVDISITSKDLTFILNGSLDDYSTLKHIRLISNDNLVVLVGDLELTIQAEEINVQYSKASESMWNTATKIYKQTRNESAKR